MSRKKNKTFGILLIVLVSLGAFYITADLLGLWGKDIDNDYYTYNENEDAFTKVLYVSPDGNNKNGLSWSNSYITLEKALDESSVDVNSYTLILVAPAIYDLNRVNATWNCNVKIVGIALKSDVRIINTALNTNFVAKFTKDIHMKTLHIFAGSQGNGIIVDKGSACFENIMILATTTTQISTILTLNRTKYICTNDVVLDGVKNYSTGLKLINTNKSRLIGLRIYNSIKGVDISDSLCNLNYFENINIKFCTTAIYVYTNAYQNSFHDISFTKNVRNIEDYGNSTIWNSIEFDNRYLQMYPTSTTSTDNIISSNTTKDIYGDWVAVIPIDAINRSYSIKSYFLTNASADGVYMLQGSYIYPYDSNRIIFATIMFYVETGQFVSGLGVSGAIESGLIPAGVAVDCRLMRDTTGIGKTQIWLQYEGRVLD